MDLQKISGLIRKIRRDRELSQEKLADMVGMKRSVYCTKEKNDKFLLKDIYKILEVMELEIIIKEK